MDKTIQFFKNGLSLIYLSIPSFALVQSVFPFRMSVCSPTWFYPLFSRTPSSEEFKDISYLSIKEATRKFNRVEFNMSFSNIFHQWIFTKLIINAEPPVFYEHRLTKRNALHFAILFSMDDIVRQLILLGCDMNKHDIFGFTPLHYACQLRCKLIVDMLLLAGANVRCCDPKTVLERWRKNGKLEEENMRLLNYAVEPRILSLENLCYITIRKHMRHVKRNAHHLGLPDLMVRRLTLEEW